MSNPLYVAFIWHMHQPHYGNGSAREFSLPWARLHATKDYLHMAEILARYPRIHATINLVPSLVEQLGDYVNHRRTDRSLTTSLKKEWSPEDREFMLSFFFSANWERFIQPHPAYDRLLQIRERARAHPQFLSDQYFRDLAAWFNLVWIDPNWLEREPLLRQLVERGTGFSQEDIRSIVGFQEEIMSRVVPAYRSLEERGQIEITTSPYYHPILPLLIDSHSAREASPNLPIPDPAYSHPEDALAQVTRAVQFHERHFGRPPRGMWPSEGAVSQALVSLLARHTEIDWIASDEGVLSSSVGQAVYRDQYGHVTNPHFLYQPYRLDLQDETDRRGPAMLFRDSLLSDRIGFVYQHMEGLHAAEDLVGRLHRIRENLGDSGPHLVSMILDGENCWEEYEHNGDTFLNHLYELLSDDPLLTTVTVSEYLSGHSVQASIPRLSAGSWIGRNFETWIGEPAQNRAWEQLARTRADLVVWQAERPTGDRESLERAWREIYIAEGSDWFWWYSTRNRAAEEKVFDTSFRLHLQNVYRLTGRRAPDWLHAEEEGMPPEVSARPPSAYTSPRLDATSPALPRWEGAGYFSPQHSSGAMQTATSLVKRLYYGYDPGHLFARVESDTSLRACVVSILFAPVKDWDGPDSSPQSHSALGYPLQPGQYEIRGEPDSDTATLFGVGPEGETPGVGSVPLSRADRAVELRIPLDDIGITLGDRLIMRLLVTQSDSATETVPVHGNLEVRLSSFDP